MDANPPLPRRNRVPDALSSCTSATCRERRSSRNGPLRRRHCRALRNGTVGWA